MTTVIETIEARRMSVRIVEAKPSYLGYAVQYEYAREGRAKLYGGEETQQWRNHCATVRGHYGVRYFETLSNARASAKRIVRNNNGG